jgi:hypothetical protein
MSSTGKIIVLNLLRLAIFAIPLLAVAACHEEGPAERVGRSVDDTAQKAKDAIDPPGPAQKAGRALDKATQ